MVYVEAPNTIESDKKSIFLAGGIQKCPQWQKSLANKLKNLDIIVFNPRRDNFPIDDPSAAKEQITWEFIHLRKADMISFWFCAESIQPIVLLELGQHLVLDLNKPLVIGVDPGYERKQDVVIQTALVRPTIKIATSLDELSDQIFKAINEIQFI
jgi:hypothetical protein